MTRYFVLEYKKYKKVKNFVLNVTLLNLLDKYFYNYLIVFE